MSRFRHWLAEAEVQIPKEAIKVALPTVRQETSFSCGPAALRAIARFYKVGPDGEEEYVKLCRANHTDGTIPRDLAGAGRALGLNVMMKQEMALQELLGYLKRGIPVICNMQAWGSPEGYGDADSGHYIVAIGFDAKKIYFEDPSIAHHDRGYLSYGEFGERWHDRDAEGGTTVRLGIAMWKGQGSPDPKRTKAKKIK